MMNVYAIYDKLAEKWSNPFVLDGRVAERTFRYMTKERNEADCEDRVVYLIGQYNPDTGDVWSDNHVIVWDIGKEKEKLNA